MNANGPCAAEFDLISAYTDPAHMETYARYLEMAGGDPRPFLPTWLVVDSVSLDLVSGCVVDFVESLGGSMFKVENPQATAGCGCGSSFSM